MDTNKNIALNTLDELFRLYNDGVIKPQIDHVYPFSKIGDAMQRMHNRQNIGKILLQPDDDISKNDTLKTSE
jgi:NADPH:quinone reductase-like Zn-dependent oxidoreductase